MDRRLGRIDGLYEEIEWDDAKAARNLVDHAISFEVARRAFDDPFGIAGEDETEDYDEDRHNLIAMVDQRILHVTYTNRGHRIRIISARLAERRERRRYHEATADD